MKQIAILTTGGTIAMREDKAAGGAIPALGAHDFQPALAGLPVTTSIDPVCNLPSAHFSLETLWTIRERTVAAVSRPEVDGVVITHGTDVLEETATLLDLSVDSDKPVVLTGAMRTASELGYEGFANLSAAIRVAVSDAAAALGTLVVFNDTVHAARYVTKAHTQDIGAFESPAWGPLGRLDVDGVHIAWRVSRRSVTTSQLEARVTLIKLTAGAEPDLLRCAVHDDTRGVVLETLGGGRVPPTWLPVIEDALSQGVVMVTASRCVGGPVGDRYGYEGAQGHLRRLGCLPAGYLNGQKARIALMVVLGAGLTGEDLRDVWVDVALRSP